MRFWKGKDLIEMRRRQNEAECTALTGNGSKVGRHRPEQCKPSPAQLKVLEAIVSLYEARNGPVTVESLGKKTEKPTRSIRKQVEVLRLMGLIENHKSTGRVSAPLIPTEAGRKAVAND